LKRKANRLARKAQKQGKTDAQYFVVKLAGKVMVLNKEGFKTMRQHGLFKKQFTATDLKKIALYHTKK
jgi:hypothetical protein